MKKHLALLMVALLIGALAGCEMKTTADDLFVGTWSGDISGQGRDNVFAIAASGVWDSSFQLEINEITIGPRMRLDNGITGRPLSGTATVYHNIVGSNFEGFKGGAAFPDPKTVSAALEGLIETSVHSSTAGEEAWRMELDLAPFERSGFIELYGEEDTYTVPIERSMIFVSIDTQGILGTNLIIDFSEDGNTMYLRERLTAAGVTGHELVGELHRVTAVNRTYKKDIQPGELITTDKNTRLNIDIPDLGQVSAGPNSNFKITESDDEQDLLLEQFYGMLSHKLKLSGKRSFKVMLPVAITGVRGTSFSTNVRDGVETIVVLEGSVEVLDRTGVAPPVIVSENQMVVIGEDGFPVEPINLQAGYPRWWEGVQFSAAEDPETDMNPLARLFRAILTALGILDRPDREAVTGGDTGIIEEDNIKIDFDALYSREFQEGQYMKVNWWQLVDGEESTGWMELTVSGEDGRFEIEYAGMLGDYRFSGVESIQSEYSTKYAFYQQFTYQQPYLLHNIFRETIWNLLDEYFGTLTEVGEASSVLGYRSVARGFDTYGSVEGLTFTLEAGTRLTYELCIAPEVPVNLYVYHDADDGEYIVELVEFRN